MKKRYRFSVTTLVLVLTALLPALSWGGGASQPSGAEAAADMAALYTMHIQAINRGDLAAVVAGYAPDAVFIGPGAPPCSVSAPCMGKDAIQGLFQGLIGAKLQAGIIDLQVSGSTLTGRLNMINDGVGAAGFGVVRIKVTVTFFGEKIARDVVEYDASDPATSNYVNFQASVGLLRQYYDAVNRDDIATALAVFADDAVSFSGNRCQAGGGCAGKGEIAEGLEQQRTLQTRFTLVSARQSGESIAASVESRNIPIRSTGVERVIQQHTMTFRGDKIVRFLSRLDVSDSQTAVFDNFSRLSTRSTTPRNIALNRGDVAGVMAAYADDAVFDGWGLCAPNPCVGKAAIQREIERQVADRTQVQNDPLSVRGEGDIVTSQAVIRSDAIRALGLERVALTVSMEVKGQTIVLTRYVPNAEDPQTGRFLGRHAPARLPATGNGGLADERTTGEPGP